MEIIDPHQHLWDLSWMRLSWLQPGSPLGRSHLPADYAAASAGLGIAQTVYMEVDVAEDQQEEEAAWVCRIAEESGSRLCGAVISGRPADERFSAYLDRAARGPQVKGVRQVIHVDSTPPGYCLQPAFIRGVRELGARELIFDICIRAAELSDAAALVSACPDTRFVLDHCGNADVQSSDLASWKHGIDCVAAMPNVVCKISGIVASAKPGAWSAADLAPIIEHCAQAFGPDRVMFASDWPVCTQVASLSEWVEALRSIVTGWPEEAQRRLWHETARRLYQLPR